MPKQMRAIKDPLLESGPSYSWLELEHFSPPLLTLSVLLP